MLVYCLVPKASKTTTKKDSTKSKKAKSNEHKELLVKLCRWHDDHHTYIENGYKKRWDQAYKLYNNIRVKEGYLGTSNTFVPMTFSAIETMVAALGNGRPRFDYSPTSKDQEIETKVINALLDTYWDRGKWDGKILKWLRSYLVYGTSIMYISWSAGMPDIDNVPIRDFIIDPSARDLESAMYAGRSYLTTKDALREIKVLDLDNVGEDGQAELVSRYKNIDKIPDYDTDDEAYRDDKYCKELFRGTTEPNAGKNQVRVYEFWTDDYVYSVANRNTIIEKRENTFKAQAEFRGDKYAKGFKPFVVAVNYADESLFYGKSEIEPMMQSQELLNDLTNQAIDAVTFALNPMLRVSKSRADLLANGGMKIQPGLKIPADPGEIDIIGVESIPNDVFNERLNLKNEIREVASTPEITKGVGAQSGSQTATEIEAQLGSSGSRFEIKMREVEKGPFHDFAVIMLALMQLYEDRQKMVKVASQNGFDFQLFDPDLLQGEFDVSVTLESTAKANEENDKSELIEFLQIALQDPTNNLQELKRAIYPKLTNLDPDVIEKIISGPDQAQGLPIPGEESLAPVPELTAPVGGQLGF